MSTIVSVNRGGAAALDIGEQRVVSGIVKRPVDGRVEVRALGLAGDEQVDLSVHGGLAKAVYMYPSEHYAFWNTVRRQAVRNAPARQDGLIPYAELPDLPWGSMGENLSVRGLDEARVFVGDVLHIGSAVLVVTSPRIPCFKFNAVMGFGQAAKLMVQSGYCGWYLEVRSAGDIGAGDAIELTPGDRERSLSIAELFRLNTRKERAQG